MTTPSLDRFETRAVAIHHSRKLLEPGEQLCLAFDTSRTTCGCARYLRRGVPCTPVAWFIIGGAISARCLTCNGQWTIDPETLKDAEREYWAEVAR